MTTEFRQPIANPETYYLEATRPHKPSARGNPQRWYRSRKNNVKPRIIVLHTAENRTDTTGADRGAENVANYFARGPRDVSIHACVDSDSIVMCLPDECTAWHVVGYNTISLGIEMCMRSRDWVDVDDDYRDGMIANCARVVAHWCVKHGIPPVILHKAAVDMGDSGIAYHATLSPKHRSDPGPGFPVDDFLRVLNKWIDVFDPPDPPIVANVPDVAGWWTDHPEWRIAVARGVTDGTRPDQPATRAEVAIMAVRAAKQEVRGA